MFSFSESDKAWDIAIASGLCPRCKEKLENFYVSEADSQLIRKNLKENNLQLASESTPNVKSLIYIGCLFILILIIGSGGSSSFFDGSSAGNGKIIIGAIVGLVILIKFLWKQLKRK
jgi:hypothetical protein